jgi:hypothetical protein
VRTINNKKKIRGWKRQKRKIEKWKIHNFKINSNSLGKYDRDYLKIIIDPWYRLVRRNPPLWLFRYILSNLIEIFFNWYKELEKMEEPFYLKIWLSNPHFINSQIVSSFRDNLHFYDNIFRKSDEIKGFPFDKFRIPELALFEWELFIDENYYFENDLKEGVYTEAEFKIIKKKAYSKDIVRYSDGTEDNCYSIKKGDIWLGKLKGNSTYPLTGNK